MRLHLPIVHMLGFEGSLEFDEDESRDPRQALKQAYAAGYRLPNEPLLLSEEGRLLCQKHRQELTRLEWRGRRVFGHTIEVENGTRLCHGWPSREEQGWFVMGEDC